MSYQKHEFFQILLCTRVLWYGVLSVLSLTRIVAAGGGGPSVVRGGALRIGSLRETRGMQQPHRPTPRGAYLEP
jgi:hypothetical protein